MLNLNLKQIDKYFFAAAILIFVVMHLHFINAPPNGYHQWRESDTSAIILNFYQEDANVLQQRCNQRGDGSGITGGELPTYSYLSAMLYFLFGAHHFLARFLTLIGSLVALYYFRKSAQLLSNNKAADYATIALAFSPLFLFYSYKIMPDIWMLMFMFLSVFFFLKHVETKKWQQLATSSLFLILSASIKPLSLCLFLPYLVYLFQRNYDNRKALTTIAVYSSITLIFVAGWYLYGVYLNSIHQSEAFYMGNLILQSPEYLMKSQFYKKLLLQWPIELWVGWALLPAFIWGAIKFRKERFGQFVLSWIIGCYIVFAVVAAHAGSHDYYTLIIVAPLAMISGWGLYLVSLKPKWKVPLVIFLLIVLPAVSFVRISSRFADIEEFDLMRESAEKHIDKNALVIVDESTSAIRLYQLNRKGWAYRDQITSHKIKALIARGGEYLLLRKPIEEYEDGMSLLVFDSLIMFGPLYGYKTINLN